MGGSPIIIPKYGKFENIFNFYNYFKYAYPGEDISVDTVNIFSDLLAAAFRSVYALHV